jgi:glycosyltransferase involved in cell wall biosynthesis
VTVLSVVMPVYNEERGVADVIADVVRHVLDVVPDSELVVVDDCSTDGTPAVLAAVAADDPRITVLTNERNSGHGPTVLRAIARSRGDWVLHIDSDGQVDLGEFTRLWDRRDEADLVLGVRLSRQDPLHRLILTRLTAVVVSVLTGSWVRDGNTPYKLIRRSLVDHLSPHIPPDTFAPSLLFVMGAHRSGARVLEVGTTHLPRAHGTSTLNLPRLVRVVGRCVAQTVAFRVRRLERYQRT